MTSTAATVRRTTSQASVYILRQQAIVKHAPYPQYAGKFDAWVAVTITKRVAVKGGPAFEKGDIALAIPAPDEADMRIADGGKPGRSTYSPRTQRVTWVPETSIRE